MCVNVSNVLGFSVPALTWGAHLPGGPPAAIGTGNVAAHNAYLLDGVQKSVLRAPWRVRPAHLWSPAHRNLEAACGAAVDFFAGPSVPGLLRVAAAALRDGRDETKISLVFANVSAADILIKPALDALARSHPTRIAVHYVLNEPPAGWTGSAGFVTPDVLKKHLPPPGPRTLVARCGPPPMNKAVAAALEGLGHAKESLFEF